MFKRVISLLLALVFCMNTFAVAAFAAEPILLPEEPAETTEMADVPEQLPEEIPAEEPAEEVIETTPEEAPSEEDTIEPLAFETYDIYRSSFDQYLWYAMMRELGKNETATSGISNEELLSITSLTSYCYTYDESIISFKGLDLLTNLQKITFVGHNFDFSGFFGPGLENLSGLTNLEEIYLNDNNLTELPDLSALTNLKHANFSGNQIPASEITADKLPASFLTNNPYWIETTTQKQLLKDPAWSVEPIYYAVGDTRPFFVTFTNLRNYRDYKVTVQYTNKETGITYNAKTTVDCVYNNEHVFVFENCGATAGTYEGFFYLEGDNGQIFDQLETFTFEFVDDIVYVETEEAEYGQYGFTLNFIIPEAFEFTPDNVIYQLIGQGENERYYAIDVDDNGPYNCGHDARYGADSKGSYQLWWAKTTVFNPHITVQKELQLPEGNYDMIVVQKEPYIYYRVKDVLSVPAAPGGGSNPGGDQPTIELNAYDIELTVGERFRLTADVYPEEYADSLIWSSDGDGSVAYVDGQGWVYAQSPGTCKIIAFIPMTNTLVECWVDVYPAGYDQDPVIELNSNSLTITQGETFQMEANVYPEVFASSLVWGNDENNMDIAWVDVNGVIHAEAPGTVYIYAYTDNDGFAKCKVTVLPTDPVISNVNVSDFVYQGNDEEFGELYYGNYKIKTGTITFTVDRCTKLPTVQTSNAKAIALGKVTDNGDGSYTVPYTVKRGDDHTDIVITANNGSANSSYRFVMYAQIDPPVITVTNVTDFTPEAIPEEFSECDWSGYYVGKPQSGEITFTVENCDKLPVVKSTNKSFTVGKVTDNGDGRYSVPYTVKDVGLTEIHISASNGNFETGYFVGMEAIADYPNLLITGLSGFTMNMDEGCHEGVLQTKTGTLTFAVSYYNKLPTVKSSNSKALALGKVIDNGNNTFTVPYTMKGVGDAEIIISAVNYDKWEDQVISVRIHDALPEVPSKGVAINGWLIRDESEKATFTVTDNDTFPMVSTPTFSGKDAENFAVEFLEGDTYLVTIAEGKTVKKGSYKLNLEVITEGTSNNVTHTFPFTVKVDEPAIKISAKQAAKLNVFYRDALAKLNITLPANIADIVKFELVDCDFELAYDADNIDISNISVVPDFDGTTNIKKPDTSGILKIWLEGYRKPVEIKFSVGSEMKAPKLAVTSKAGVFYPGAGLDEAQLSFTLGKDPFAIDETIDFELIADGYAMESEGDALVITRDDDNFAKSTKATITIQGENWAAPVSIPYTMKVETKTPALKLVGKAMQLNGHEDIYAFDTASIEVAWKDVNAAITEGVTVSPADAKAEACGIEVTAAGSKLVAKLTQPAKKGSYKFNVSVAAGEATATIPLTVKVVETDMTKAAAITAKGTIDLLNRSGSSMVITPALKAVNGTIEAITLQGDDAANFEIVEENGKLLLKAKADAVLKTKTTYSVVPVLTLSNNYGDTMLLKGKAIAVKPTQGKPKLTVTPAKPTLQWDDQEGITLGFAAALKNLSVEIANVELVENDMFTYDNETGILSFAENFAPAKGKKYTLQFNVTYAGHAENEKPAALKYTVSISK